MPHRQPITFGYAKFEDEQKGLISYKPVIDVILKCNISGENVVFPMLALIDSGADFNILHADIAKELGITDLESGEYLSEIGGVAEAEGGKPQFIHGWRHPITINIRGVERETDAVFSPNIANYGFCILGQVGFFDKIRTVTMNYRQKKIIIKP